jgi:hypothetical protein
VVGLLVEVGCCTGTTGAGKGAGTGGAAGGGSVPNDGSVDPGTAGMPDEGDVPDPGDAFGEVTEGGAAGGGSVVDGVIVVADCDCAGRLAGAAIPPTVPPRPLPPLAVPLAVGAGGCCGCGFCDTFIATTTRTTRASTNTPAPMI